MTLYEHNCRDCGKEWLEEHSIHEVEKYRQASCPGCESVDTFIAVTTAGAVHFKGAGWSPDGYNKYKAYDSYKGQGLEVFDRKEDLQRVNRGEAEQRELKKLKHLDRVAKRTLGPDAGVKQYEAERKIKAAGEEAVKSVP